jgi:urease accessory protein
VETSANLFLFRLLATTLLGKWRNPMRQKISKLVFFLLLMPGIALSHTGVGETTGITHGFGHPMGGADHLLAMFAVGLWAAQIGKRALWLVPAAFVGVMIFGGILGFAGMSIPFVEAGIVTSVLILGVLIAGAVKLPLVHSTLIVGVFAIFHGYAHGAEMPVALGAASYTLGFALATAVLHLAGIGVGMLLWKTKLQAIGRFAGGAIALSGVFLAIS